MTKWPVDGSVADRPEGVLQNVKENLDWQRLLRHDHRLFQEEEIGGSHRVCIFKSLLAVLRPAIWFGDWAVVCPGKCLSRRTNWHRYEFCPGKRLNRRTNWQRNEFCPV